MWPTSALVRHAARGLVSDVARSLLMVILLSSVFGVIIVTDLDLAHDLRQQQSQRLQDGLNVVLVTSKGGIDPVQCELLSSQAGIVESGSIRERPLALLGTDRATLVPVGDVSAGMLALWGFRGETARAGLIVGSALAKELAMVPGSRLPLVGQEPQEIVGVFQEGARTGRFAGWALATSALGEPVDQCWVEVEPGLRDVVEQVVGSVLAGKQPVEVTTLTDLDASSSDLDALFQRRLAVQLRWPLVLMVSVVALLSVYARRSEYGLSRALGMRVWDVALVTQVEWLIYTGSALLLASSVSLVAVFFRWQRRSGQPLWWGLDVAAWDLTWPVAAALVVAPLVAAVWRFDIVNALKDR